MAAGACTETAADDIFPRNQTQCRDFLFLVGQSGCPDAASCRPMDFLCPCCSSCCRCRTASISAASLYGAGAAGCQFHGGRDTDHRASESLQNSLLQHAGSHRDSGITYGRRPTQQTAASESFERSAEGIDTCRDEGADGGIPVFHRDILGGNPDRRYVSCLRSRTSCHRFTQRPGGLHA